MMVPKNRFFASLRMTVQVQNDSSKYRMTVQSTEQPFRYRMTVQVQNDSSGHMKKFDETE